MRPPSFCDGTDSRSAFGYSCDFSVFIDGRSGRVRRSEGDLFIGRIFRCDRHLQRIRIARMEIEFILVESNAGQLPVSPV